MALNKKNRAAVVKDVKSGKFTRKQWGQIAAWVGDGGDGIYRIWDMLDGEGFTPRDWYNVIRHDPFREDRLGLNVVGDDFERVVWEIPPHDVPPELTWENVRMMVDGNKARTKGGHLGANPNRGKSYVDSPPWMPDDYLYAMQLSLDNPQWGAFIRPPTYPRTLLREVHGTLFLTQYYNGAAGARFIHTYPIAGANAVFPPTKVLNGTIMSILANPQAL